MRLLTFGELCLHVIIGPPASGRPTIELAAGGAPAYFARQARALGADVELVAVLGTDTTAGVVSSLLDADRRCAPSVTHLQPSGPRTARLLIRPDATGEALLEVDPSGCRLDDLTPHAARAQDADMVHLAAFPGTETLHHNLAVMAAPRVIDYGFLGWRTDFGALRQAIGMMPSGADVLIVNGAVDTDEVAGLARNAVDGGKARIGLVTHGAAGATLIEPGRISYQPTPAARAVCTVGAGDSLAAAFVIALAQGRSPAAALTAAQAVAARKVEQLSAPAFPPVAGWGEDERLEPRHDA